MPEKNAVNATLDRDAGLVRRDRHLKRRFKLSHVWKNHPDRSFGLIGAYRPECSETQNQARLSNLRDDMSKAKIGHMPLMGAWSQGHFSCRWPVFLVPDSDKDPVFFASVLTALGKKYGQHAIMVGTPDHRPYGTWLLQMNGKKKRLMNVHWDQVIEKFYCLLTTGQLENSAFRLKWIRYWSEPISGWMEGMSCQAGREIIDLEYYLRREEEKRAEARSAARADRVRHITYLP